VPQRILVALGVAVSSAFASADRPEVLELELRLIGALGQSGSLTMDLARTGDRWERVWAGDTESRKIRLFTGRVAEAEVSDRRVALSLDMRLAALSEVRLDLMRSQDGRLEGRYVLTSRSAKTDGEPARAILFMNRGDGSFDLKPTTFSGLDGNGICGEAADLNNDGLLDLVFAADPRRYEDKVYWNTGRTGTRRTTGFGCGSRA
jgi:hypothetical protein